ncbi:MAG: helix-turn-helix domain-containing protein [Thermoleophilia bacterium]|nr:helix-turn-helix domain-containing protein [Thermoleophilia bacterium]
MALNATGIDALRPLTATERAFRLIHTSGLSCTNLDDAPPEVRDILRGHPADEAEFVRVVEGITDGSVLDEDLFFDRGADMFMNVHPRFMPALSHAHHFFELQYVLSGSFSQDIGGGCLGLGAGDVCFIAPGTEHALLVFDEDTLLTNILIRKDTFRSTFIDLLKANDIISDFFTRVLYCNSYYPYMLCRASDTEELTPVVLRMMEVGRQDHKYKDRLLRALLQEFFIYLLRDHECDFVTASASGRDAKNVVAILSFMQQNFRTVTLSGAAHFFSYDESHLSRMIKAFTGSRFSEIVKTIKLQHAADLLANTAMPISEVIADSGYEDKSYFYRAFGQKFGVTPAEYRRGAAGQS